ncbi:G-type lectin S-receptor-like serine/threonine-protein kinase RLK1 [Prosopis cineraria]|uniref:G-type lectin S-receptor-like serine/threonine-protein kinase RLK1 n=1 Tax=Prosopis cineraria TaxID=364024 RepID=UPI0024108E06|nr:G-type lectin S-receptor-like serine/threonine-protein kinase RLK1 [Prosopis cineraria]
MAFSLIPLQLCTLFLCVPPICVIAQTRSISHSLRVGDSLTAGDSISSWVVSPYGDFAFGFQQLEDDNFFLLSTWYAKIPNRTIVWYANGDHPAPKGSRVQLTASEGLKLTSPDGQILWTTRDSLSGSVVLGALNDFGNFVLKDRSLNSVWEAFEDPKDTLLPSQVLGKGGMLSSRKSETDFARGRFQLLLRDDGKLVMHSINLPSGYANENYFETETVESNTSSPAIQLVLNKSGDLYVLRKNNNTVVFSDMATPSPTQFYLRATLDYNGVFSFYQHPKSSYGNETWTPLWSQPDNICTASLVSEGTGVCGYNSICTLDNNSRPVCRCPEGYSLVDPDDPHGSCQPYFIDCKEEHSQRKHLYEVVTLTNVDWPLNDYDIQSPSTEEECKRACFEDCFCAVSIFRLGDTCWKKTWPLKNGRDDPSLDGSKAFLKVQGNSSQTGPPIIERDNQGPMFFVFPVLLGCSAFLNIMLIGSICLGFPFIYIFQKKIKSVNPRDGDVKSILRCFTYEELEEATNGFIDELGRGSFGVVYKGVINMGSTIHVAVKRLNNFLLQEENEMEFKNEVNVLGQTHHKNLVRLLGFCEEGEERLLVYEFMSNGTLASLLFNDSKPSWNLRLGIAFGVAKGLLYLHEDCDTQIIHCDIKPQNILLDDFFNPQISDFGLAKLLNMNQSQTYTAMRGTKGYVALEWFKNMPITAKVDVYSFGVLLLEIVCCRRSVEMDSENAEKAILADWAYDCFTEGSLDALVEQDQEALDDNMNLEKLVMIAIWCVQEDPTLGPSIKKVFQMLEGVVEVPTPPCQTSNSENQYLY